MPLRKSSKLTSAYILAVVVGLACPIGVERAGCAPAWGRSGAGDRQGGRVDTRSSAKNTATEGTGRVHQPRSPATAIVLPKRESNHGAVGRGVPVWFRGREHYSILRKIKLVSKGKEGKSTTSVTAGEVARSGQQVRPQQSYPQGQHAGCTSRPETVIAPPQYTREAHGRRGRRQAAPPGRTPIMQGQGRTTHTPRTHTQQHNTQPPQPHTPCAVALPWPMLPAPTLCPIRSTHAGPLCQRRRTDTAKSRA